jgi:hypothetical protein
VFADFQTITFSGCINFGVVAAKRGGFAGNPCHGMAAATANNCGAQGVFPFLFGAFETGHFGIYLFV